MEGQFDLKITQLPSLVVQNESVTVSMVLDPSNASSSNERHTTCLQTSGSTRNAPSLRIAQCRTSHAAIFVTTITAIAATPPRDQPPRQPSASHGPPRSAKCAALFITLFRIHELPKLEEPETKNEADDEEDYHHQSARR